MGLAQRRKGKQGEREAARLFEEIDGLTVIKVGDSRRTEGFKCPDIDIRTADGRRIQAEVKRRGPDAYKTIYGIVGESPSGLALIRADSQPWLMVADWQKIGCDMVWKWAVERRAM